jgi:hypothetical protein
VENEQCLVLDFLEELEANGDTDSVRLNNLILQTADYGVRHNKKHIRSLGDDIYEFKAPNTGRILFFYDKNRLIICAHGFTGKKGSEDKFIKTQIKKAERIKDDYFAEKR